MSNDEIPTKVAERPLTPLMPEHSEPIDPAAYRRWYRDVVDIVYGGASERAQGVQA